MSTVPPDTPREGAKSIKLAGSPSVQRNTSGVVRPMATQADVDRAYEMCAALSLVIGELMRTLIESKTLDKDELRRKLERTRDLLGEKYTPSARSMVEQFMGWLE